MKRIFLISIVFVSIIVLASCNQCKKNDLNFIRYVGVYIEVVEKDKNERNMNDVNPKLYIDEEGILNDKKNSYEYRIEATKFGPNQYQKDEYMVYDFGAAYSLFINSNSKDINKVDIYPVVYNQNDELIILDSKIQTVELEDQVAKTMTYEKSYEYNGQKRHLKVSINITKKIVG
jgi:hypothetical protein